MAACVLTWSFRTTKVIKWKREGERGLKVENFDFRFFFCFGCGSKFSFYACRLLLPRNIWLSSLVFFLLSYVHSRIYIYISNKVNAQRVYAMHGNGAIESVLLPFSGFIIAHFFPFFSFLSFGFVCWLPQHWPPFSCTYSRLQPPILIRTLCLAMIYNAFNTAMRCIYDSTHCVCRSLNSIWLFVWI